MQQLILAIDSDPRQSAQLAALVRARLKVELVQATSAGEGLAALGDRLPDLILTSPLLSPFDDGVLDEYLRDLGPAATHVQTLRIPLLSATPKRKSAAGRLFSLGRKKVTSAAAPDGCDPKLFADEITHYLTRAAEESRASASRGAVASEITYEPEAAEPVYAEPAYSQPAYSQPAYSQPAYTEPVYTEPAYTSPVYTSPVYTEPVDTEPVYTDPAESEWAVPQYVESSHRMNVQAPAPEPVSYLESALDRRMGEPAATVSSPHQAHGAPGRSTWAAAPPDVVDITEPQATASFLREVPIEEVSVRTPAPSAPVGARAATSAQPPLSTNSASFEAALAAIRAAWAKPNDGASDRAPITGGTKPLGAALPEVDLTNNLDPLENGSHQAGDEERNDPKASPTPRAADKSRKRPRGLSSLVKTRDVVTESDDAPSPAVTTRRVLPI